MDNDGNGEIITVNQTRNVFYYKTFGDCKNEAIKKNKNLKDDYENKLKSVIHSFKTSEGQRLNQYLSKMKSEVSDTSHRIFRIRLTNGEHHGTGISRIFFCFVKEIPSLKRNKLFHEGDVMLLYFTYDQKGHDEAQEIFASLNHDIDIISDKDVGPTERLLRLKDNTTYEYVVNSKGGYTPKPVLSSNQALYFQCCTLRPPCIIHGSAGSGKTLLSEELYEYFSKDDSQKSLYITYMDQLKIQVIDDLKNKRNIRNTDCKTIDDLVIEHLGRDIYKQRYKKEADFKDWVLNNKLLTDQCRFDKYKAGAPDLLKKINRDIELAISIAYIFYRTFSTEPDYRSFNNNPKRGKNSDEGHFLQLCRSEEGLNDDQKRKVFYLCQKYENYLKTNGYINDNEAARIIAKKNIRQYDSIIIDEVQDLTETQIKCLTTLLKDDSSHFYVFGDDNQSINPTMMDISDVRTCLREHLNQKIDFPENIDGLDPLDTSYRSTTYLVNYINYVNRIRRNSIGTNKSYNEKEQKSALGIITNSESDYPAYILGNSSPGLVDSCLKQKDIVTLNDVVIITANDKTKNELLSKFPHLNDENADYVCTIEETKGREWDQVILYNFFTSAVSIWSDITRDDSDRDSDVVSKGRHSSIYRMYFNRYYVGLTRAKNKVIMMETGDISGKIAETYFPADRRVENVSLEQLRDVNKFNAYFENEHTHDVWDQDALECFRRYDYEEAVIRVRKAIVALEADSNLPEKDKALCKASYEKKYESYSAYWTVSKHEVPKGSVDKYLSLFINDKNLDFLKLLYESVKDQKKLNTLSIDPTTDYDTFLASYSLLSKNMSDDEKEFFNSNAILAYKQKIFDLTKGVI